jgi:hypothetical protein
VIKFEGFKKLIDQVGGITVNVEGALKRDHRTGKLYRGNLKYDDNWGNLHIDLKPGMQNSTGNRRITTCASAWIWKAIRSHSSPANRNARSGQADHARQPVRHSRSG